MKTFSRKTLLFLLLVCVLIIASFPIEVKADSNNVTVEDTYKYFNNEEIQYIEKTATQLPEVYRFIILPSISDDVDIKKMAESLFISRNFSQDTIFILVITDERKIHITTGEALQKKDLNQEFFNTEINKYFVPNVKEKKNIAVGLVELIKGISKEIPQIIETNKSSVKLPESLDNRSSIEEDNSYSSPSFAFWLGLVALFLLIPWLVFRYLKKRKK